MKKAIVLTLLLAASTSFADDKPVHVFIFSGQSNMAGMDPETGFVPEARKLFGSEEVVYIKVAKGGQPICRWLEEWADIAEKKGLDARHRERILKGEGVLFYQPILDQYKEMLDKYPKPTSVTFCWMQGERDANGGADAAYKDALELLIAKLRRDLKRTDMNIVIGRIGDYALDRASCVEVRKVQVEIANEDSRGAWVDVDDLNDKEVNGEMQSVVHYNREGYVVLGQRFARQGYALVKGKEPAEDGRPSSSADASAKAFDTSRPVANGPNIVFLMTDDQRWDTLGCYGREDVLTPHIDELASQSVVFDNAYYAVAICMPSRTTMFTGRYFSDHKVGFTYPYNRTLPKEEFADSYPAQLRKAGYRTGFIGKFGIRLDKTGGLENTLKEHFDFFVGRSKASFPKARADEGLKHIYREGSAWPK